MRSPQVELVYFTGCPGVDAAREAIRAALAAEGLATQWREWNRDDEATPRALRGYGSPTVLVNGCDVAPAFPTDASCCRVYSGDEGLRKAPSVGAIRAALRQHQPCRT